MEIFVLIVISIYALKKRSSSIEQRHEKIVKRGLLFNPFRSKTVSAWVIYLSISLFKKCLNVNENFEEFL